MDLIRGSVGAVSFIFTHPPEDKKINLTKSERWVVGLGRRNDETPVTKAKPFYGKPLNVLPRVRQMDFGLALWLCDPLRKWR